MTCCWRDCQDPQFNDLPVCFGHGLIIAQRMDYRFIPDPDLMAAPPAEALIFVYYLMVDPCVVKISATQHLGARIQKLRSNIQYVVALEHGPRSLERQRHQQFAQERIGRREDFLLSTRLKRHITTLQPRRDELIRLAKMVHCT